jgi:2-methylisocitrate lyase-like PEP mutase family enzyme
VDRRHGGLIGQNRAVPDLDLSHAAERAAAFAHAHHATAPLVMANAWDPGSAKLLAHLGFPALATTSAGFANSLGRPDGGVTREEAIGHAAALAAATELPVSADLEHCFGTSPAEVAETVALAAASGIAGCSIEDWDPDERAFYDIELAAERVAAAAEAAHAGPVRLVLTARADNHFRRVDDLDDTVARLQAYERAGADVLYAPGWTDRDDIARIVEAVGMPVNVIVLPGVPPVSELAELGVARISVGSGFALTAYGALVEAGRELLERGTYGFWELAGKAHALRDVYR